MKGQRFHKHEMNPLGSPVSPIKTESEQDQPNRSRWMSHSVASLCSPTSTANWGGSWRQLQSHRQRARRVAAGSLAGTLFADSGCLLSPTFWFGKILDLEFKELKPTLSLELWRIVQSSPLPSNSVVWACHVFSSLCFIPGLDYSPVGERTSLTAPLPRNVRVSITSFS